MALLGRGIRCIVSLRGFQPSGGSWHHATFHRSLSTDALVEDNTNVLDIRGTHPLSATFQGNAKAMEVLVSRLNQNIARACEGGGQKAIDRNAARGKLLPRQRISALLDPGSPFLELSQLAGHNLYGTACQKRADISAFPYHDPGCCADLQALHRTAATTPRLQDVDFRDDC